MYVLRIRVLFLENSKLSEDKMNYKRVKIFDTTLRDGSQGMGISFSLDDKLRIARALDELGVHYIEGGWPGSNPKDISFFEKIKKVNLKRAKITAFSSTKRANIKIEDDNNIQTLVSSETPVFTIFGKSWDLHVEKALKVPLEENLNMIFETIRYLRKYSEEVIYDAEHFFDGYIANKDYALKTLNAAEEGGADVLVLADTNGGTPWDVLEDIISDVKAKINTPFGIHAHNDSDMAVVNSLIAVKNGAVQVQGTINGIGERCGNANLCSIIPNLHFKMGIESIPSENIKKLTFVSRLVSELSNRAPVTNLPFVGENAFAHKGGIHVSAVRRETKTYEHISPEFVGNKRTILVSELSGKSNMLEKAEELGIKVDKNSPAVQDILKRVKEMESRGYYFEGAEASFELLFKSLIGKVKKYFDLKGFRVFVWKESEKAVPRSEAIIKGVVPEEVSVELGLKERFDHTSADGGGPVEALDKALRKVLEKFYPNLKEVKLVDYKVRILNEQAATKAVTRVLIRSTDGKKTWGTVGVSENIIEASWIALTDAFKYKLLKDDENGGNNGKKKSQSF